MAADTLRSRAEGCLLGLAAGNMLGLPIEGRRRRADPPVTDIALRELGLPWDDDLALAFELGESLAAFRRAEPRDLAARFVRWARVNGRGIGNQTAAVIALLEKGFAPFDAARQVWERSNGRAAGNGAVMRCAPVGLAFPSGGAELARAALDSAAVTHFDPRCTHGCVAVAAGVAALLAGAPALPAALAAVRALPQPDPDVVRALEAVPTLRLDTLPARVPTEIGFTLHCMQIGLWAAEAPGTLEEILVAVVSEGGDADTNAAVAGALLGARHGGGAIPQRWLERIRDREKLVRLAGALLPAAGG